MAYRFGKGGAEAGYFASGAGIAGASPAVRFAARSLISKAPSFRLARFPFVILPVAQMPLTSTPNRRGVDHSPAISKDSASRGEGSGFIAQREMVSPGWQVKLSSQRGPNGEIRRKHPQPELLIPGKLNFF